MTVREGEEGAGSGHDRPGSVEWRMDGGPLRSWVLVGGPARVLDGFARLTGRASLPPVWALGRHHALGGPVGERELRGLVAGWAERGVVPSAVHVGEGEDGGGAAGADRSPSRASGSGGVAPASGEVPEGPPDLPALAKSLGEDGVRLVRTAGSGAPPEEEWGAWCEALPAQGFSGVFRDRSAGRAAGVPRSPAPAAVADAAQGRDGLSSARAAYAGLRAARPGERPFVVTYDGRVGAQRYGAVWCGDGPAGWPGLRAGLAQVLGLGLCGVPFAGLDTVADGTVEDAELALRRLQLAAFLPLLRTGRGDASGSAEGEAVLRERERLRPYLLSLACLARWTGAPVVRPLWWGSPRDRRLRECEDAFLLGEALLVAPVLEPGCVRRAVRLPRGRWYDTATGAVHEGPGRVLVDAPRGRVPVLARAGSVLAVRGADGGAELEAWAPAEGRTGGGLVVREAGDGWVRPRAERLVTRWEGGAVVVERVAGEERVPARGPVRVRGLG